MSTNRARNTHSTFISPFETTILFYSLPTPTQSNLEATLNICIYPYITKSPPSPSTMLRSHLTRQSHYQYPLP